MADTLALTSKITKIMKLTGETTEQSPSTVNEVLELTSKITKELPH